MKSEYLSSSRPSEVSLVKVIFIGVAGGLVASGVKSLCELIAPPRAPCVQSPLGNALDAVSIAVTGEAMPEGAKSIGERALHFRRAVFSPSSRRSVPWLAQAPARFSIHLLVGAPRDRAAAHGSLPGAGADDSLGAGQRAGHAHPLPPEKQPIQMVTRFTLESISRPHRLSITPSKL